MSTPIYIVYGYKRSSPSPPTVHVKGVYMSEDAANVRITTLERTQGMVAFKNVLTLGDLDTVLFTT